MTGQLILKPIGGPSIDPVDLQPGRAATIGRAPECDVCLPDESVSRKHASVERREVAWFVMDLGSTGGTTLCSDRLEPHRAVILRDDDELRIGRYTFGVTLIEDATSGPGGHDQHQRSEHGSARDHYRTRESIFLRLRDDETAVRELSWEEFRRRYAPVVVGFARNLGLPAQDADDVLQEVLMAFFQVSPRFEYDPSKGRFRGYLKRMTRQAVAELRRRAGRAGTPAEDLDDADSARLDETWDGLWAEQLFQRAVEQASPKFEAKTMEAFDLFARRGVPAEEVARRLGMSVNSVHHAKSRVLKVVQGIVERIRGEEG